MLDKKLNDKKVWISIIIVFIFVLGILVVTYNHSKEKPDSPQAVVAAAFNQLFSAKEWQPGMGTKPLIYHPAGFTNRNNIYPQDNLVWKTLPDRQKK
ncbi:MAG: hypothetical protein HQK76_13100 [Desulfobacterales bacterium]|nr:hypothetical protein [Desulfobacterales bacterium]